MTNAPNDMSTLLRELDRRNLDVAEGGGVERQAKHKEGGRLSASERLAALFDDGEYQELERYSLSRPGALKGNYTLKPGDGLTTAVGRVRGRTVCAFAHDATIYGGTTGRTGGEKLLRLSKLAAEMKVPLVGLNDSAGARIQEGIDSVAAYMSVGHVFTQLSGLIPNLSAIMGTCAGGPSYGASMTDFIIMVADTSHMFVTGPDVVSAMTAERSTKDDLGGYRLHSEVTGACHRVANSDAECISDLSTLLSYLPQSCLERPPHAPVPLEPVAEPLEALIPVDSRKPYEMTKVIESVLDAGSWYEISRAFARNVVTGFGRIGGYVVGMVANQPKRSAGIMDVPSSRKVTRFVRWCDSFNVPIITLVDTPGFVSGVKNESAGMLIYGSQLLHAYSEASTLKLTVALRKCYGGAYASLGSKQSGAQLYLALPTAEIAVMGPLAASRILMRGVEEDESSLTEEFLAEYKAKFASPYSAAALGHVDEIVAPNDLRGRLHRALDLMVPSQALPTQRKHVNFAL